MKLNDLLGKTDLDMNVSHIKAFFLGALSAEKPMPFNKAMEELLSEAPEAKTELEGELKALWDDLLKNKPAELQRIFPEAANDKEFLEQAKDQLDFYLTAMSLSGTHTESVKNEDLADLIDELEDTVMELDEYLSEEELDADKGKELRANLLEVWTEYLQTTDVKQ